MRAGQAVTTASGRKSGAIGIITEPVKKSGIHKGKVTVMWENAHYETVHEPEDLIPVKLAIVEEPKEDHGYHALSKYSRARDDLLHYLCLSDWAEADTGNSVDWDAHMYRISNTAEDVAQANGEFNSVIDDWFATNPEVTDSPELRAELVGHFSVITYPSGHVGVHQYDTVEALAADFKRVEAEYAKWDADEN